MEWIKITTTLPPFGERVLFRGIITWRTKLNLVKFFDDVLTTDEETLDSGHSAYVLKDNSDYLVSQHPNFNEVCDEFVTHWCKIPAEFS
jgi:hypothetical protein